MTSFEQYARTFDRYVAQIEYPAAPRALYDPIRYTMAYGGKRLRPLFVLGACGLWRDEVSRALPAAAAVEMFHNFTLIHDDIMDNAPTRRGRESVFRRWGVNAATLSGDSLMIHSWRELARTSPELLPAVVDYFNEAAVKVCEGQQLDMDFESRDRLTVAEHTAMIELKTASLFVGAVSMGAMAGGASDDDLRHLREFALPFGVAFQMQDDLLDSYGDERLGKTVGGDILEGKKTFLKMKALAVASPADRAELSLIHKDLRHTPGKMIARVLNIYDRYGVRAAVEEEIGRRFAAAAAALDALTGSVSSDRIEEFKTFALGQLGRAK
ncbi:MAG: polyprenyl synthetase family protein [Alistipes sp.]|jgi:geranylgeranyl diphosphate synthase type II|nr:polyprenyl synthetase family protein [Alistipes sp.]